MKYKILKSCKWKINDSIVEFNINDIVEDINLQDAFKSMLDNRFIEKLEEQVEEIVVKEEVKISKKRVKKS